MANHDHPGTMSKINVHSKPYPMKNPYILVDFDGTLCEHHSWTPWNVFGPPIPAMVERVLRWREEGKEVRIFTARVFPYIFEVDRTALYSVQTCVVTGQSFTIQNMIDAIDNHIFPYVGERLPCTCAKDYAAIEFWDDRAVQVIPNTGRTLAEEHEAVLQALRGEAQGS